jgi:hypothetical protein
MHRQPPRRKTERDGSDAGDSDGEKELSRDDGYAYLLICVQRQHQVAACHQQDNGHDRE